MGKTNSSCRKLTPPSRETQDDLPKHYTGFDVRDLYFVLIMNQSAYHGAGLDMTSAEFPGRVMAEMLRLEKETHRQAEEQG